MKRYFIYTIEWDNWKPPSFGASMPRTLYLVLYSMKDSETISKEKLSEKLSEIWYGKYIPISFRFREATSKELTTNCYKNSWPIYFEKTEVQRYNIFINGSKDH